jgi:NAD(P)-dependent dehydrogenase (short-subunit alcohol dehydrogenase family)
MSNAKRLEGKIAFVSGSGSVGEGVGNGRAISMLFAREGASIFGIDRNLAAAQDTQRRIAAEGGICEVEMADVSKGSAVKDAVDKCLARFGRIHVLVNNVGIAEMGGPVEMPEEDWDRIFAVNLKSMFLTAKYVLPVMEKQGGGTIVNISSVASIAWSGSPFPAYSASKAAVNSLTQHIAMQYAKKNIRANVVLPGLMNTPTIVEPMSKVHGGLEKMIAARNAMCPTGQMGDAWDVANAALFLACEESRYVTAAQLVVDGGLTFQCIAPAH